VLQREIIKIKHVHKQQITSIYSLKIIVNVAHQALPEFIVLKQIGNYLKI
jgi:hypothetical protein